MSPQKAPEELAALSTLALLDKASGGDEQARNVLYGRYLPRLKRWARGRLPQKARGLVETDDLVQDTLLKTLGRVERFHPDHSGAFLGYVRRAIDNRIVDEVRRASRRPAGDDTAASVADPGPSPLEQILDREKWSLYEQAFERLDADDQVAITARLEEGMPYEDIARELGKPSADAARMAVSRAVLRLARAMQTVRTQSR